ncbi:hypothetical protein C2E23DRAFT_860930 [Lenzites betulinus]|nr:hypothetical protein C2E23DRAFT_860930 [Lenzites betulinus]
MPPSNISIERVTSPSDDILRAAVDIYVEAMYKDPTLVGATAGQLDRAHEIILAVLTPIARECGELYVATDAAAGGALVGFSAWVPPGRSTFDTEEQKQMGLQGFTSELHDGAREPYLKTVNEDMPRFIDNAMGVPSAEKASYWCWFAAVRPEYRRQGIARRMLEIVTQEARAQGGAVLGFLASTAENAALAEKQGFATKGHTTIRAPWGEWEFWCLAKETAAR